MSVASALKQLIEQYAAGLTQENELLLQAREGSLQHATVARYLTGLRRLVAATPDHLRVAITTALQRGNEPLAVFLQRKLAEEEGHHEWAESDLEQLRRQGRLRVENQSVAGPITELVGYLSELVARDPEAYIGYIFLAEYFTVLMGPEWLTVLEERCGVPRDAMTVVGKHVELDIGHVEEATTDADSLLTPSSTPRIEATVKTAMGYYDAFFADLARFNRECHPPSLQSLSSSA